MCYLPSSIFGTAPDSQHQLGHQASICQWLIILDHQEHSPRGSAGHARVCFFFVELSGRHAFPLLLQPSVCITQKQSGELKLIRVLGTSSRQRQFGINRRRLGLGRVVRESTTIILARELMFLDAKPWALHVDTNNRCVDNNRSRCQLAEATVM